MAKPQILKDLAEVVQKIIHKESKKDPEKRKWGKKKIRYCQTQGPVFFILDPHQIRENPIF